MGNDTAVQVTNLAHLVREQRKCFKLFDRMFDPSYFIKPDQTAPNKVAKR